MSSDNELESIRNRRMVGLRQQILEEQRKSEQLQALEVQKRSVLRQILTSEARQRLNRIKLVKPDFVAQVELQLIQVAQTGKIRLPVNDEQLKQILIRLMPAKREIRFRRM